MRTIFEKYIERVLSHEGGWVNHPDDPGLETKFGISKRSYPNVDIKNLTRDGAKDIYYNDFWLPVASKVLDPALTFQLFDSAVNHGMGNTVRFLQRALNVADDGHWGRISQTALTVTPIQDTLLLFLAERLDFMRKLSTFKSFGSGWSGRIAQNLRYAAQDN